MTAGERAAVNRALSRVADMLDVVIRVCSWCAMPIAVEPSATWGSCGLSHGLCAHCSPPETPLGDDIDGGFDDAAA